MWQLAVAVAAVGIGWVSLACWPAPFGWIGLTGFAACIAWFALTRSSARFVCLNLAFVFLVPGLYELYHGVIVTQSRADPSANDYIVSDDVFGYRLRENATTPVRLYLGDTLVYDVRYETDAHGLRTPPPFRGGADARCIVFYGGSFSFGMGLPAEDTSPWLVAEAGGFRDRVTNIAYPGWGPHQMLSALEAGRFEEIVDCVPTQVVYHSVHDHVRRVAGAPHDAHGPRYVLDDAGVAQRAGHFDDVKLPLAQRCPQLAKSHALRIWEASFDAEPQDYTRFHAVVDATRSHLERAYPGVQFDVLVWNKPWKHDPVYWEGLAARGIRVHTIDQVLPGYPETRKQWGIPHDGHPNRAANEHIARYVVAQILGEPEGAQ